MVARTEGTGRNGSMYYTYFIGPAGSGKSTLTYAIADWLKVTSMESEISDTVSVACVNLDPGVRWTPYPPDVDVRDFIDYNEVMRTYQLGPNGALVAATDLIITYIDEIKEEIQDTGADYVFIDTPGQIELFSFRVAGPKICKELGGKKKVVCFLFEPGLVLDPSGFISTLLLSSAVEYRFFLPHLNLLSKSDILDEEEMERIIGWSENFSSLNTAIDMQVSGMEREKSLRMSKLFEDLGTISSLIPVSSKSSAGLDGLYAELQRIFAGGEDFESET
ncbi:GTPase [Candidatus Bathyarchaeota archaeon]|nr:GTPase [Candidatus Bathyarchaeota archaeon]